MADAWRSAVGTPARLRLSYRGHGMDAARALRVYQPMTIGGRAASTIARATSLIGLGRSSEASESSAQQFLVEIIGRSQAAAVLQSNGQDALVARTSTRIFKVAAASDQDLLNEAEVLSVLPPSIGPVGTPALVGIHENHGYTCLEFLINEGRPRHPKQLDDFVVDVAVALHRLGITHGDFVPWNILFGQGEATLIDWARAHSDDLIPGWDLLVWHVQSATHLQPRRTPEHVAREATAREGWLRGLLDRTDADWPAMLTRLHSRLESWMDVPERSRVFAHRVLSTVESDQLL